MNRSVFLEAAVIEAAHSLNEAKSGMVVGDHEEIFKLNVCSWAGAGEIVSSAADTPHAADVTRRLNK